MLSLPPSLPGVSKDFWQRNIAFSNDTTDPPYVINTHWGGDAPGAASLAAMSLFFGAVKPNYVFGQECAPEISRHDTLVLHIRSEISQIQLGQGR
jgi:hypothetical protein